MVFLVVAVVFLIWFYRAIPRNPSVAYKIYRHSGFIALLFLGLFVFVIYSRLSSDAKGFSATFLLLALPFYIIWYAKVCAIVVKSERKGFLFGIVKIFAYVSGYGFLGKRMYEKFEVESKTY